MNTRVFAPFVVVAAIVGALVGAALERSKTETLLNAERVKVLTAAKSYIDNEKCPIMSNFQCKKTKAKNKSHGPEYTCSFQVARAWEPPKAPASTKK